MAALPVGALSQLLDDAGGLAFALSGAMIGARRGMDIFGVVILAFVTSVAGGIGRDVLIGSLPPDALKTWHDLALAALAGMLALRFGRPVARLHWLVQRVDAAGLAMFAVTGASKALDHGLMPAMAAVLGMVTAVGGGIVRDIMAAQIPTVLTSEIYAIAALLGAAVVAAGPALNLPPGMAMLLGMALCLALRLVAIHRGWRLPAALAAPRQDRRGR